MNLRRSMNGAFPEGLLTCLCGHVCVAQKIGTGLSASSARKGLYGVSTATYAATLGGRVTGSATAAACVGDGSDPPPAVPEPGPLMLIECAAVGGLLLFRRRRA